MRLGAKLGGCPFCFCSRVEETYILKTATHHHSTHHYTRPPHHLQDFLDRHAFTAILVRSLAAAGGDLGVSVREG